MRARALAAALVTTASLAAAALGCGPTLPEPLAAEAARTPKGKITVIEFIDFQCPFCRKNHETLSYLLTLRSDHVRLVRKHVPLRKHENAFSAALAAVCAEEQGRGEQMADRLVASAPEDLRADGCAQMAEGIGLDMERYRACVAAPKTAERVRADDALFNELGERGVPVIFIGEQRFVGLQPIDVLERALDDAISAAKKNAR